VNDVTMVYLGLKMGLSVKKHCIPVLRNLHLYRLKVIQIKMAMKRELSNSFCRNQTIVILSTE
jgi:hypothetical protein